MAEAPPTAEALADLYRLLRGRGPDAYWQALFAVAACSEAMWAVLGPRMDLERGLLDVEGLERLAPELGRGEALMQELARCLFRGHGCADLAGMAQVLDERQWLGRRRRRGCSGEALPALREPLQTLNARPPRWRDGESASGRR